MGVLEDFNKMLERIPIWKRLGEVPAEVDDLKKRLEAIELRLGGKWPPDVCKFCGEQAARLDWSGTTDKGKVRQDWRCTECKRSETRIV